MSYILYVDLEIHVGEAKCTKYYGLTHLTIQPLISGKLLH